MSRHTKDYSYLIGQKLGDRTILSVIRKNNRKSSAAYGICKCKCGSIDVVRLSDMLASNCLRCKSCAEKSRRDTCLSLIGQKIGDREILSVTTEKRDGSEFKYAVCKCKCGRVHNISIYDLTRGICQRCTYCAKADTVEPNSQNKLGIRHISFDSRRQSYVVNVTRNGVRKAGRAKTLAKVKALKERFLEEFEKENAAND